MGIRPTVRGTAMSPRDHPHGGGEGRQPTGMPGPKTPWGKPARGYKTRRIKRTDKYMGAMLLVNVDVLSVRNFEYENEQRDRDVLQ